jgi:hypothetical protein
MGLQVTDRYYEHIPERVINVNSTTIMWDRTVLAKSPDVIIHDEKEKTCLLIDIALPDDSNFNTKENEKLRKYQDLEIRDSRMWKVGTKIVPVIIGASETIKM